MEPSTGVQISAGAAASPRGDSRGDQGSEREMEKQEQARYKNSTDGRWLAEREDYYKALSESQYLRRRAHLLETIFAWWTDILRARSGISEFNLPALAKETRGCGRKIYHRRSASPDSAAGGTARSPRPQHPGNAGNRGGVFAHFWIVSFTRKSRHSPAVRQGTPGRPTLKTS